MRVPTRGEVLDRMLRVVHRRHVAPLSLAVALLVPGLLAGLGGAAVPGGTGPTVTAVPHDGPLGAVPARDLEPEPGARYGAHPVTFPTGSVRVRPAVAREERSVPDFTDRAVPASVLAAYRSAESALDRSDPGCRLDWPLLAGIGKVESGHAYGGAVDRRGTTLTPILGPVLDGGPGVAAIPDTDDGRWDTDTTWDRAVGPMQFIPSSWTIHGQDGNADGLRDPNNVVDAARASAGYLCSGDRDVTVERDRRAAVFSYNHSWDYVDLVLAWAEAYAGGTPVLTGGLPGGVGPDGVDGARARRADGEPVVAGPGSDAGSADTVGLPAGPAAPTVGASAPTGDPGTSRPGDDDPATRDDAPADSDPTPTKDEPSPSPTKDEPSPSPTKDEPTTEPEPSPSGSPPTDDPTPTESPDGCPTPTGSPTPTESPTPSPDPEAGSDPCPSPSASPTPTVTADPP